MSKKARGKENSFEEQIKKLKRVLREKDRTIKQLKSEISTLELAWQETTKYLQEATGDKPLSKIMSIIDKGAKLPKNNDPCPKCNSKDLKVIIFPKFHIISCEACGYRDRIDEEKQIEKNRRS